MRIAAAFFIGFVAVSPASATDWRLATWISDCGDASLCSDLKRDWPRAFKGDPEAQKNMTFYFSSQGRGVVRHDDEIACAWEIVLLASRHQDVTWMENSSLKYYCGRPLVAEITRSRTIADELFREIYKKSLPSAPWEIVAPVSEVRLPRTKEDFARMAISAQVLVDACPGARIDGKRLNALSSRMGIQPSDIALGGSLHGLMVDHGSKLKALMKLGTSNGCRSLTDGYGPSGLSLQGVAVLPVTTDYPN